jgi:hypothetical protein
MRRPILTVLFIVALVSPALAAQVRCITEGGLEVDDLVEHEFASDRNISTREATSP